MHTNIIENLGSKENIKHRFDHVYIYIYELHMRGFPKMGLFYITMGSTIYNIVQFLKSGGIPCFG